VHWQVLMHPDRDRLHQWKVLEDNSVAPGNSGGCADVCCLGLSRGGCGGGHGCVRLSFFPEMAGCCGLPKCKPVASTRTKGKLRYRSEGFCLAKKPEVSRDSTRCTLDLPHETDVVAKSTAYA